MTFSDHFKHSLKVIAAAIAVLFIVFFWLKHKLSNSDHNPPKVFHLPADDRETISYDEKHHVISVTTEKGTTSGYSRNPMVEVRKDGQVVIHRHMLGLESGFFMGLGYADVARMYFGVDFAYWWKLDLGVAVGLAATKDATALEPVISLGYNVYSNTSLNLGLNPLSLLPTRKPEVAGFVSVKF